MHLSCLPSVSLTEYLKPGNLERKGAYVALGSGGWEVQGMAATSGKEHHNIMEGGRSSK